MASRRHGWLLARCPPGATDVIASREQAARPASHAIKDRGNEVNRRAPLNQLANELNRERLALAEQQRPARPPLRSAGRRGMPRGPNAHAPRRPQSPYDCAEFEP
jgi:hypothetical protein